MNNAQGYFRRTLQNKSAFKRILFVKIKIFCHSFICVYSNEARWRVEPLAFVVRTGDKTKVSKAYRLAGRR